jgi:hypothetical protein
MPIGILTLHLHLPGCSSLKEKRRRLKPLLIRLRREFNISVAEMDCHDIWQDAVVSCALVSNDNGFTQRNLRKVVGWIETYWPDVTVVGERIELL